MKTTLLKSTLMALLFASSANVMAQPTTAAPTPPEYAASKVLSIYSDAFTPATGWNFGVWESGSSYSQIQVEGDNVAQFNVGSVGAGYFGWEFHNDVNAAAMTHLHLDVWMSEATTFHLFPICRTQPGEKSLDVTTLAGQWTSVDLNLDDYEEQGLDLSGVFQLKFADNIANKVLYVDNVYFYNNSTEIDTEKPQNLTATLASASYYSVILNCSATDNSGAVNFTIEDDDNQISQTAGAASGATVSVTVNNLLPSKTYNFTVSASDADGNLCESTVQVEATTLTIPTSAPAPQHASVDVISIFSDTYESATNFNIGGWGQTTISTKVNLTDNDEAYLMDKFNYVGWELNGNVAAFDASAMEYLHVDVYTPNAVAFRITPIWGGEALYTCTPLNQNEWNSYDIPLSVFNGINLANIYQIKMEADNDDATVFVDNVYFWKENSTSTLINEVVSEKWQITVSNGQLTVCADDSQNMAVYSLLGTCLHQTSGQNMAVALPAGTYIVKVGADTRKVLVY